MEIQNDIEFLPTSKQFEAYELLEDKTTTELLFGGSISSGKSRLACYWVILSCLKYPGTRYLIGRARLQNLKRTTIKTFLDIALEWGISHMFNYNRQDNIITFDNGSEVILIDLFKYPSDPEFVKLGSLEITGAVIDEAGEITQDVYKIIKTRLRYKLKEYNLIPKLLIVSNPTKNWLYSTFFQPSVNSILPPYRKFIQSLPSDNHYNSIEYIESLTPETLGYANYNRLVLGDWDYDDSDLSLYAYNDVMDCFNRQQTKAGVSYITVDPAAQGADKTVISVWYGLDCIKLIKIDKSTTQEVVAKVNELRNDHAVKMSHVIVDKVGIGQGVFDLLKGCKGFVANARALKDEPYKSLKDQMYYTFSKFIKNGMISIADVVYADIICQELEAHKIHNIDKDVKAQVTPKAIVKQMIGRSPDFADALSMRMYFTFSQIGKIRIIRR